MLTPTPNNTFAPHTQSWERKKEKLLICLDYFFVPFLSLPFCSRNNDNTSSNLCDSCAIWMIFSVVCSGTLTFVAFTSDSHSPPTTERTHFIQAQVSSQAKRTAPAAVSRSIKCSTILSWSDICVRSWSSRVTTVENTSFRLVDTTKEFQRHEMSIYFFSTLIFTSSNRRRRRCAKDEKFSHEN